MPVAIALLVIFGLGLDLRVQSVADSVVENPARADAGEYVLYAYNLKRFGVYSKSNTLATGAQTPPPPDAVRVPFYPLFIVPFLSEPPTFADLRNVTYGQMLLSLATVLALFCVARLVLPIWLAVAATALTAASPHLVTMNIYLLSETLFCFLLVVSMLFVVKSGQSTGWRDPALAGALLAAASLAHPMLLWFTLPLAAFWLITWGWQAGHKKTIALLVGFGLAYGGWTARNLISLGTFGDSEKMLTALRSGVYAGLKYQNDPTTYGYPDHADPNYPATSKDLSTVLRAVAHGFNDAPLAQLQWYLIGKPIELWSWDNRAQGQGDVFIYPTPRTPYSYLPHFQVLHQVMKLTHWFWVLLMAAAVVAAWIPGAVVGMPKAAVYGARVIAVLLLCHVAVMIAGFPLPRYSIPLQPFLYVMAMFALAMTANRFRRKSPPH
jgi:4-amino-4-deoxy-L-arabinose transferase-like glycosyltransferase